MKLGHYIITLALFLSTAAQASKEYNYNFMFKGERLNTKIEASSPDEAFEKAVQICMKTFKGQKKLNESAQLDLVDTCVNPRS